MKYKWQLTNHPPVNHRQYQEDHQRNVNKMRLKNFEQNLRPGVVIEAMIGPPAELVITYKEIITRLTIFVAPQDNKYWPGYHRKHPKQLIEEINNILDEQERI